MQKIAFCHITKAVLYQGSLIKISGNFITLVLINIVKRINRRTSNPYFKMQMWTCTVTGITRSCNSLSLCNTLSNAYLYRTEMSISCHSSITMCDINTVSIISKPACSCYSSGSCSCNCSSLCYRPVNTFMKTSPSVSIS